MEDCISPLEPAQLPSQKREADNLSESQPLEDVALSKSDNDPVRSRHSRKKMYIADRKRKTIEELLARVLLDEEFLSTTRGVTGLNIGGVGGLSALYQNINTVDALDWSAIPPILTSDNSTLVGDETMLKKEQVRQDKYRKKLLKKLADRDIDEEEMSQLLEKHGRGKQKTAGGEANEDHAEHDFMLLSADRGLRKRQQIENFAVVLQEYREIRLACKRQPSSRFTCTVADFGCGSGNLCLPLAALFPDVHFLLIDRNDQSLDLARRRASQGGVLLEGEKGNVSVLRRELVPKDFQDFSTNTDNSSTGVTDIPSFDLGIGLHCCGSFTDLVMHLCELRNAACIVAPCCNGKMGNFDGAAKGDADMFPSYPRSAGLSKVVSREEYLQILCPAADDAGHYGAKCLIELDRGLWGAERERGERGFGSRVRFLKLSPESCTPKHHMIVVESSNLE